MDINFCSSCKTTRSSVCDMCHSYAGYKTPGQYNAKQDSNGNYYCPLGNCYCTYANEKGPGAYGSACRMDDNGYRILCKRNGKVYKWNW